MASWLVCSSCVGVNLNVRALTRNIVLCSWARHFTLTVPLSTQVYKWVPVNLMPGVTLHYGPASHPRGGEGGNRKSNTLSCFMLQKPG